MDTTKITKCEEWTHPLFISTTNNQERVKTFKRHIQSFMFSLDMEALKLAKANADWHDDKENDPEGYAEMHTPAEIQFPADVRRAVAIELFEYFLTEGGSL